ncbi:MAG: MBOAT family O-acyltransferase [Bacteroidota bacterium]
MSFIKAYILILLFTIITDFFAAQLIDRSTGIRRKWALMISLGANLGILFVFKYYNFFAALAEPVASVFGFQVHYLAIALPLGLSFQTLQAMGYCIEVFHRRAPVERNFMTFAQYVLFYPQLVAGPIERPQQLMPQIGKDYAFNADKVSAGLRLMLWGFFKKLVIADRLAPIVDSVFDYPDMAKGPAVAAAAMLFSVQIFCDFSGYTDIARGCAKILGIDLVLNFRQPYLAKSVSEFWRRWHLSLSTWLRDYVYIPLGGNRKGKGRQWLNLLAVMLLSGLWHGAGLNFLVWGGLHAVFMIIAAAMDKRAPANYTGPVPDLLNTFFTFLLVSFAWIFFRAANLQTAMQLVQSLPSGWNAGGITDVLNIMSAGKWAFVLLHLGFLAGSGFMAEKNSSFPAMALKLDPKFRIAAYYAFILAIFFFGQYSDRSFIYFQF